MRLNFAVGINSGARSKVRNNFVHDNGEMGLGGSGDDMMIENNEISYNGYFSGLDPYWEGGGSKWALTNRLIVRNNFSHHNNGYGLWTDIDNYQTLYEGNRIEDNIGGGIVHEISYDAVIKNNTIKNNGFGVYFWAWGAAIMIQNSQGVEVYGNRVEVLDKGNAITLIQQNRGSGNRGAYLVRNNYIHNNTLIHRSAEGTSGATADYDEAGLLKGNNRFNANSYYVLDANNDHWMWGDWMLFPAFRSAGQEASGSVNPLSSAPK